ncbi:MAG: mercury(II) reductase [Chloroflexota bacterium]|nr:MAG: mercury(II) reductase [Chloroflexota bacterium]
MTDITYRMSVEGMTCAACDTHVVRALEGAGAKHAEADFRRGEAIFRAAASIDQKTLVDAVRAAGYQPSPATPVDATKPRGHQDAPVTELTAPRRPRRSSVRGAAYDLVVIGSGSGAFAAAITARELGAKVMMVERGTLGGTCVNIGCVPSKTLLRAAELYHQAARQSFAGVETRVGTVDLAALIGQKDELIRGLRSAKYEDLVAHYGWDFVHGEASFVDESTLSVDGREVRAKRYIIATGARPAIPPIAGLAETNYLTSTTALELTRMPERLVVVGSGYIALEIGQLFSHLSSEVTLMQRSPRILKEFDPEIGEAMHAALSEQGIRFVTGVGISRIDSGSWGRRVHFEVGGEERTIECDELLVATGRTPNTAELHLDRARVNLGEGGAVLIDNYGRTSNPRVFAAGDVTLAPQFVYVAAYMGALAARNALRNARQRLDLRVVPRVTFTSPAFATVGLSEAEARAAGHNVKTSVLPASAVPRALVNRDTRGVFKIVADAKSDRILGVHVVAENAGDVIYAGVLAIKFNMTVRDLVETFAPYLTMAEGLKLAAQSFGRDIARLSCCAA